MPRFVRRRKRRMSDSGLYTMLISAVMGIGMIIICLMGFAFILSRINAPAVMVSVLATVALGIGGYFGGYFCARKRRRNGMFMGVMCGVLIFMTVLIFGAVFAKAALGISSAGKLMITMLCGAVGGIVGVNTKKHRY